MKINLKSKKYYQLKAKYREKPRERHRIPNPVYGEDIILE